MANYLITGVAGFIGSHTADTLLEAGYSVTGVDNFRTGSQQNLESARKNPAFELIEGDVTDERLMSRVFEQHKPQAVLHLAGLVSVPGSFSDPALNFRLNIHSTDVLARLVVQFRCPRIVFASSAAVYGDAQKLPCQEGDVVDVRSPYAMAKLVSETILSGYAASFDLTAISLRYFNVYGPRQAPTSDYSGVISIFAQCFIKGEAVTIFGDGLQTRDFIAVSDVAVANMTALTHEHMPSGVFNVCTGRSMPVNDIVSIFQKRYPDSCEAEYVAARTGDIRHSCGDPAELNRLAGFSAQTGFESGLNVLLNTPEP